MFLIKLMFASVKCARLIYTGVSACVYQMECDGKCEPKRTELDSSAHIGKVRSINHSRRRRKESAAKGDKERHAHKHTTTTTNHQRIYSNCRAALLYLYDCMPVCGGHGHTSFAWQRDAAQ